MPFTVTWLPVAEAELAELWVNAPDKQAVSDAADEIDRLLRLYPMTVGEEHGLFRRLIVEPLEVVYRVFPDDYLVRVLRVDSVP